MKISCEYDDDQIAGDWEQLLEMNEQALKAEPTWAFFGGLLYVEDRTYQVIP
jgi:hypothetical protein